MFGDGFNKKNDETNGIGGFYSYHNNSISYI